MHAQYNQLALKSTKRKICLLPLLPPSIILANQPPVALVDNFFSFPSFVFCIFGHAEPGAPIGLLPRTAAVKAPSPNHWATQEFQHHFLMHLHKPGGVGKNGRWRSLS